jgi:hypothetical protein
VWIVVTPFVPDRFQNLKVSENRNNEKLICGTHPILCSFLFPVALRDDTNHAILLVWDFLNPLKYLLGTWICWMSDGPNYLISKAMRLSVSGMHTRQWFWDC